MSKRITLFSFWAITSLLYSFFSSVVVADIRYSVPEESKTKYLIGSLSKDLNLDVKGFRSRKARLDYHGEARYCGVDLDSGHIVVLERIDRETLCGPTSPCILHFEFILENPLELHNVILEVQDVNDNTPVFPKDSIKLEISETAPIGSKFQIARARDLDVGVNSVQNYILSQNVHFDIDARSSKDRYVDIVLKSNLDREKKAEHSLMLTAVDGGNPPRSGSVVIQIMVQDFNDNAPIFSQPLYRAQLFENAAPGTSVIKILAIDEDEGVNGELTYYINHLSESTKNLFQVDEKNGELLVTGKLDHEIASSYEIEIQAEDGGGQTGHCKVVIEILDVNDNAPVITVKSLMNPIPENMAVGSEIGILNVKDQDSGENSRLSCSIPTNLPFKLQPSIKNYFTLITTASLDREQFSEYNVTITASDGGTPSLFSTTSLNIKVADINDNFPVFEEQSYSAYVAENNKPGTSISSVTARDPDWRQNGTVLYSLLPSEINGVPVSSFLSINSDTGVIHAVRSFDYEKFRNFKVQVVARDNGSPPLSSNVTVSVFISDENDNSPQILYPAPEGKSLMTEMVPKAALSGSLLSKVIAVDADSGQNAWLSYHIVKSTDPGLFTIGLHSGEIRAQRDITESDSMKQNLVISVKDNGQPPLSATCSVYLLISDNLAEVPELKDMTYEESNSKLTFYLIIALVSVSTFFLTFIILILAVRFCHRRKPRLLFDGAVAIPSAYLPPNYAEVEGAGTLRTSYNYDTYLTTGSRTSDFKFITSYNDSTLTAGGTFKKSPDDSNMINLSDTGEAIEQKPPNNDWRLPPNQRPGPSGQHRFHTLQQRWTPYEKSRAGVRPEEAGAGAVVGTGPWPNPPTEAEQLQALMAAANEVSEATATLGPRYNAQYVPDYRQNVYIPGSTATLTANPQQQMPQQALPPPQAPPQAAPSADVPKAAPTPASKKKVTKKDKK
ncbi:protocadherin beta-15-like isoform X23 [Pangasianodon hypophthalmus]|uniref:protocadherin beta-15-like isoform X23 n=1 Tax=Pangasianodon hypophthalmus TaxID=310915 RepID=UPI0023080DFA|nr:protocadherin beta-15-like isoform X23 [Pangasianodon hypophthalmus]